MDDELSDDDKRPKFDGEHIGDTYFDGEKTWTWTAINGGSWWVVDPT